MPVNGVTYLRHARNVLSIYTDELPANISERLSGSLYEQIARELGIEDKDEDECNAIYIAAEAEALDALYRVVGHAIGMRPALEHAFSTTPLRTLESVIIIFEFLRIVCRYDGLTKLFDAAIAHLEHDVPIPDRPLA